MTAGACLCRGCLNQHRFYDGIASGTLFESRVPETTTGALVQSRVTGMIAQAGRGRATLVRSVTHDMGNGRSSGKRTLSTEAGPGLYRDRGPTWTSSRLGRAWNPSSTRGVITAKGVPIAHLVRPRT